MPKNPTNPLQPRARAWEALIDRPLVWLLPFYLAGVYWGWQAGGKPAGPPLGAAAVLALAALGAGLKRLPRLCPIVFLMAAAAALGWGLTARSLAPSHDPTHINNFINKLEDGRPVILGGFVAPGSEGRPEQNYRLIIDSREIIVPGPDGPLSLAEVHGSARIGVGGPGHPRLEIGDYVRLPVILRPLSGFKNPGAEGFEKYWAARGIRVGGFVKSPALITSWPGAGNAGVLPPLRSRAEAFIGEHAPPPVAGLLAAQLIGRRSAVDAAGENTFRALGLSHILSVSGLHMGLWYGLCFWIFRLVFSRFIFAGKARANIPAAVFALGPTLFYAAMVGSASPVIRAAATIFIVVLASLIVKRRDIWNIIFAAAWVILLYEPYRLFTASFQLSFVATAAMLAVFTRRPGQIEEKNEPENRLLLRAVNKSLWADLWERLKNKGRPTAKELARGAYETRGNGYPFFRRLLLASLAGTLGTAPLVVWHFSRLPLAGLGANLIFTPLISALVLAPGLLALSLMPLSPALAALPMKFSALCLGLLMPLMDKAAELAGPGLLLPAPSPWFLGAFYLAGWLWLRGAWRLKIRLPLAAAVLLAGFLPGWLSGPGDKGVMRLTVLDVGQGSSIHINYPDGSQMLIDGGGTNYFDPGESLITAYLSRQGLRRLDVAALTHPDQDHLKGLVSIGKNFKPREIWDAPWPEDHSNLYREFRNLTGLRPPLAELYRGRKFGDAEITLIWPPPEHKWPQSSPGASWTNNSGLVFKISRGDFSFLITGDIEQKTEKELAARFGDRLAADVLLAPHHGSRTSLAPEFLRAVKPRWVVFSAGRNNAFGLPHPDALKRARDQGAEVRRTDQSGAIIFEVRPVKGRLKLVEKGSYSGE